MSDPDEPDDLEDVTLWAGRLRAWPAPPAADADVDGDETVRSRRPADVGGPRSPSADPVEDTVRSVSAEHRASIDERDADAGAGHAATGADGVTPDDLGADVTVLRGAVTPADSDAEPEDDTTAPAGTPAAAPVSRGDGSDRPEEADVTVVRRAAAEPTALADFAAAADATASVARRRPTAPFAPVVGEGSGTSREAHSPAHLGRETYAPRIERPVRVARAASDAVPRGRSAAASLPRRDRARSRLVLLGGAILVVVALAVMGVALLVG